MSQLRLYELPLSPNNLKVRIALGFKGLEWERQFLPMDGEFPFDRSTILDASAQPLTPVLQHGEVVIFDSGAIMRYLEANFRDTPSLFSEDYREMKEIETWEWLGRTRIAEPVGMVFNAAPEPNAEVGRQASTLMREQTAGIEERLAGQDFLIGNRLTAADVTCIPYVYYATMTERPEGNPIREYFYEHLQLGEGRDRTRAWVRRVMEFDPHPAG